MDRQTFIDSLQADGYLEPVLVERAPNTGLDEHAHPFAAKALILDGAITIAVGGVATEYGPGDVFQLQRDEPHAERYGPQGVRYLSGRR